MSLTVVISKLYLVYNNGITKPCTKIIWTRDDIRKRRGNVLFYTKYIYIYLCTISSLTSVFRSRRAIQGVRKIDIVDYLPDVTFVAHWNRNGKPDVSVIETPNRTPCVVRSWDHVCLEKKKKNRGTRRNVARRLGKNGEFYMRDFRFIVTPHHARVQQTFVSYIIVRRRKSGGSVSRPRHE